MDTLPSPEEIVNDPRYDELLVKALIETIRDPLLVLDDNLRVIVASSVFYKDFQVEQKETLGCELGELGNGQWDIPALRTLLLEIIPQQKSVVDYEVEHTFPHLGKRTMLVTAQEILFDTGVWKQKHILISFNDVTDDRAREAEHQKQLDEHKLLLREVHHRIANNLQLIIGILLLKAESAASPETLLHLTDTHNRIMSVALLEQHLQPIGVGEYVDIKQYLTTLCEGLTSAVLGDDTHVWLTVDAAEKKVLSAEAVLLGLITTELVVNALKHAFKGKKDGEILVSFEVYKDAWRLCVTDNGIGLTAAQKKNGMGSELIESFARQLKADVERESNGEGTKIYIVHRLEGSVTL